MQTSTNLDNPLDHVFTNNFEKYVKNFGGTMCVGVMNKDGKFFMRRNKEILKKEDRLSMKWFPETDLSKLTMKLNNLMKTRNQNKMKQYASTVVKPFQLALSGQISVNKLGWKCYTRDLRRACQQKMMVGDRHNRWGIL